VLRAERRGELSLCWALVVQQIINRERKKRQEKIKSGREPKLL
jgi:hypothetical protein